MRGVTARALGWPALPALALALAALAGCAPRDSAGHSPPGVSIPASVGPAFTPVAFSQIPGWGADRLSEAMPAFLAGCDRAAADPRMAQACERARAVPPGDDAAARAFFEQSFQPTIASNDGSVEGLITGYYEPEFPASRTRTGPYQTPLLRRPPPGRQSAAMPTRAQIVRGALARRGLEMLWVADPIDAFFLQIQGSGRARLPDGTIVRVTYDGQNGHPYVPIGRVLVNRGEMTIDEVSMQTIRTWLKSHPREAAAVMDQNPSYVFFREVRGTTAEQGPPGAMQVPLTPGRSVAVDRSLIPLGLPVFLDTHDALQPSLVWRRLTMAQDVGGAIRGATRADIFFGWGPDAEERAGRMRQPGTLYVLQPR